MKPKIPFRINYPLRILDKSKKINFSEKEERQRLFRRNLFYYKFDKIKNNFLEKRWKTYFLLAKEIQKFINKKYPKLEILSISAFGSALYSKTPNDFDFLVIVKGNKFLLEEMVLKLSRGNQKIKYFVGISIKGVDNFSLGILDIRNKTSLKQQKQVIDRTVISLFRRHLPVLGYDFIENKEVFQDNIYAQCFDLLENTYNLYYLRKEKSYLTDIERGKKILSRLYEAISYLNSIEKDLITVKFKKELYNLYNKNNLSFSESKKIFNKFKGIVIAKSKKLKLQISKEICFNKDEQEFRKIIREIKKLLLEKKIGKFLPVVAKIVDERGKTISSAKRIKRKKGPIHAEISAINDAKKVGKTNWKDYTLYCSLEPCWECARTISSLGFRKVVYCISDPLLSYYGRERKNYGDKKISFYQHNSPKLIAEFQKIYSKLYKKKINLADKSEILEVLSNEKLRKNISKRLNFYWKIINLPYQWIDPILKILLENKENEDLAIRKVRNEFPGLIQRDSPEYSQKLTQWRKRKVRNLAKKLNNYIVGDFVADIGGRSTDFAEQIISFNQNIKKFYVTDLGLFSSELENNKISFLVQPSKTALPFKKDSVHTIILSMVLHHLKSTEQEKLISNAVFSLRKKGRIILIEDTYPEINNIKKQNKNINDFLKFSSREKKNILSFYDWFGNRLMRNRDQISLVYNYKSIEKWKKFFERHGMKGIFLEFVKEDKSNLSLFPPKAIIVFEKIS